MSRKRNVAGAPFESSQWPAASVQMWKIGRIKPYPQNPRTHPPEQIKLLAQSMREEGVTMPILVDETGVIIAGHGRLLAAQENKFEEYPVVMARGWTDEQKRSARIRDNQLGLLSGWDAALIHNEIVDLKAAGYDIAMLGFPEVQLRAWDVSGGTDGVEVEQIPERPKKPIVRSGDRWVLGEHVLLCGDSTSKDDVGQLIADGQPALMVTDPPYGVKFARGKYSGTAIKGTAFDPIANDDLEVADLANLVHGVIEIARLKHGAAVYMFSASLAHGWAVPQGMERAGIKVQSQLIWAKQTFVLGRCDYHWQHELIWYGFNKTEKHFWCGARNKGSLLSYPKPTNMDLHPTMKPVELIKELVQNSSKKGWIVYEPFSGSGTTIIACEMTGRLCRAIEIDPGYVEVTIERWQKFTGKQATLDGQPFDVVAKARRTGRPKRTTPKMTSPARSTTATPLSGPGLRQAARRGAQKKQGAPKMAPPVQNRTSEPLSG